MKNKFLFFILLTFIINVSGQNQRITLNFDSLNKKEAIKLIEKKTNYKFYFLENWFDSEKVNGNLQNKTIIEILDHLFDKTNINYFVSNDGKVILTKGTLIRPSIYEKKEKNNNHYHAPIINDNNSDIVGKETELRKDFYFLTGIVRSKKNKKALEAVTIFERAKNIFTTTDSKGYFSLELPYGKNYIEVSAAGFSSSSKPLMIHNDGNINFYLAEKDEQLDEVVVNAKKNINVKQTVAGITQIKAKDIKTIPQVLGERDILKAATTLPGIKSAGEGAEGINVRGGKIDQNLFLLDEGVMYNPTHFLGLFSAINPFTTESLDIYKGNTPAEYGGRISSVFDIKTKDANIEKFTGEASIGPVTGNISIETPIIKNTSGLLLGVRSTYSDWLLKTLDDKKLSNSSASFQDFILKYNHKINDNNSLKLTGYYSNDEFQIASDSLNSYNNTIVSLNWFHKFNDKNKGNLIVSNSSYKFGIDFNNNKNRDFNLKYHINETNLKLKLQYLHSKKHQFSYGIETKLYNVSPGTINPEGNNSLVIPLDIPKEKGLENGIFLSDKIKINKKLSFDVGLRFSQYLSLGPTEERIYQTGVPKNSSSLVNTISRGNYDIYNANQGISYRLSGRYLLNDNLSVKAGINKLFQYIHRLSSNTTASPIDTWRLSDNNIKPQEGTQFSLGVFQNLDNSNYELSLEGYYKDYKNLLDYKTGANLLLNETIETEVLQGPGKSYGVEFLIRKKQGKLNGWLGYTYSRSLIQLNSIFNEETVNGGNYFPTNYDKPHNLDLILNYKLTERYSLSSNFTYQSGRPITYPTGKFISQDSEFLTYSNRNEFRIPDYFRLDIGLNIEGNHKIKKFAHSFWNISIYNVLGRNNPYSIFFETASGNVNGFKTSIFSTPIPTITYNFKF